ncbi:hypothetical protein BHM03_00029782 [Ensete ventricosum]|uniref:Uncharacterized protein n=1 Tax=Ensete ventricosum TaxID=4639 RepID=A0A426ZM09_ENSVE|nr:hypothetical protein B296_00020809 [Ensete ventricosum]RZS00128.1 hypothetical protein BHM03_00029782 [Ensete ventricosum]
MDAGKETSLLITLPEEIVCLRYDQRNTGILAPPTTLLMITIALFSPFIVSFWLFSFLPFVISLSLHEIVMQVSAYYDYEEVIDSDEELDLKSMNNGSSTESVASGQTD